MGRLIKSYLNGTSVFACASCHSHLALHENLESDTFRSGIHRAFLMTDVVNVNHGAVVERTLTTGLHSVSDIFCCDCGVEVGWYYHAAHEASQTYKVGKYVLIEPKLMTKRDREHGSLMANTAFLRQTITANIV